MDSIVKWLNENGGILSIIALLSSLPMSFYGSVLASRYLDWRAKKSKRLTMNRINQIEKELDTRALLSNSYFELIKYIAQKLMHTIIVFMFGFSMFVIQYFLYTEFPSQTFFEKIEPKIYVLLSLVSLMTATKFLGEIEETLKALSDFPEYKNKIKERIDKLQEAIPK